MPQTPSSPLQYSVSLDDITAANSPPSPTSSTTGNLPGGTSVRATSIPRSRLKNSYFGQQIVELYDSFGDPTDHVKFNGSKHKEALKTNPTLRHLEEHPALQPIMRDLGISEKKESIIKKSIESIQSEDETLKGELKQEKLKEYQKLLEEIEPQKKELMEIARATQHVLKARHKIEKTRFNRILPAGDAYREAADVIRQNVERFLAETNMPTRPDYWRNLTGEDLGDQWRNAGYHVYQLSPSDESEDSDSDEICEDWENGHFDNDKGATFINIGKGPKSQEWLVWLEHDRRHGYNLSTSQFLRGYPSEIYSSLEKYRPDALRCFEIVFIAFPSVSRAFHALKKITSREAHQLLTEYADSIKTPVIDIDFDQFGRFIHSHYPDAVVARYDTQELDVETLGAVLDASEKPFLLMKMHMEDGRPILQETTVRCFEPSMKAFLNKERIKYNIESKQYLKSQRKHLISSKLPSTAYAPSLPESDYRLYNASNYDGEPEKFEMPSAILRRIAGSDGQIGIISTGSLHTSFFPDEATVESIIQTEQVRQIVSMLEYAGIKVESAADLARYVYKTYGVMPEVNVELIRRYVQSRNDALPHDKKITITLEVKQQGDDLPYLGDDPKGYLIEYQHKGQPLILFFQKHEERAILQTVSGRTYDPWHLNDAARDEDWWNEGPVSILHFEGENLLPLLHTTASPPESTEESDVDNDLKRQRSSSGSNTPSLAGSIPRGPAPKKGRFDTDAS